MEVKQSKFTPFSIAKEKDKCIIVMGQYQASPIEFSTFEDAEKYLETQPYEMFMNLYAILKYHEEKEKNGASKE